MQFVHLKCGGDIDTKGRRCLRCKKVWNPISFLLTSDLRPERDSAGKVVMGPVPKKPDKKRTTYAKWAEGTPAAKVAGFLPDWPRWARLLSAAVVVAAVVSIIILVWR